MLKLLIYIILTSISTISYSQVGLTLYGGPIFRYAHFKSSFSLPHYRVKTENNSLLGNTGFRATIPINKKWNIECGAQYSRKDFKVYLYRDEPEQFTHYLNWTYLINSWEMPVSITYNPAIKVLNREITLRGGMVLTYNHLKDFRSNHGTRFYNPRAMSLAYTYDFTSEGIRSFILGAETGISIYPVVFRGVNITLVYHVDFLPAFKQIRFNNNLAYFAQNYSIHEKGSGSFQPKLTNYLMFQLGYTFGKN